MVLLLDVLSIIVGLSMIAGLVAVAVFSIVQLLED